MVRVDPEGAGRFASSDLIGAHVSAAGGACSIFDRGRAIGANALGFFSKNNNRWWQKPLTSEECDRFRELRDPDLPLLVHAAYLINLAATDEAVLERSLDGLTDELSRAEQLGVEAVVLHPGAHMGAGVDQGLDRIARSIDSVFARNPRQGVSLLLETSAGQGSSLCCSFEEIGRVIDLVDQPDRVGVCIDTCHVFAAGYELRTDDGWQAMMEEIDEWIGIDSIAAFHLNDSKRELGSRVDRHESIGEGQIGLEAFGRVLNDPNFRGVPKILETPKTIPVESDRENLSRLRSLLATDASENNEASPT